MDLNVKFYIICFLDSLALGLFLPVLATHIASLGGSHTILGILATLYTVISLFSNSLTHTWSDTLGKKATLLLILTINYVIYIPFGTTTSYVNIILLRLLVGLTNQTQTICNSFLAESNSKENLPNVQSITNVMSVAGFVVGPMIGGIVYAELDGFYYLSRLAGIFLFICILIATTLPHSSSTSSEPNLTFVSRTVSELQRKFGKLTKLKIKEDGNMAILKFLHSISTTVFFMKFSMLLRIRYELSSSIIGCTYSYQGSLTFLAPLISSFIDVSKSNSAIVMSLFIATSAYIGLCFAKSFEWYLISFIPMILAHALLNTLWKKTFRERATKEYQIEGAQDGIGELASIVTPFIFGISCDLYGVYALQAYTVIPMLISVLIAIVTICSPVSVKKVPLKAE